MIQYRYLAVTDKGKKCRGTLSAESPRAARAQLLGQQLTPISLTPENDAPRGFSLSLGRSQDNIRGNDLVLLTRQLSTLVAAALPLEEALLALAQQSEKPRHRALLEQVRNKILEGQPLADALASFPKTFTLLFRTMVAAGEASGHLDNVLLRLADNAEQSQKLKSKMLQAMIYPLVLTVVAIAVVAILLTAVVPKVIEQFIHMQQALPLSTRALISLSDALRDFGLWALLAFLLTALGVRQWLKPADNLMWWHKKCCICHRLAGLCWISISPVMPAHLAFSTPVRYRYWKPCISARQYWQTTMHANNWLKPAKKSVREAVWHQHWNTLVYYRQ